MKKSDEICMFDMDEDLAPSKDKEEFKPKVSNQSPKQKSYPKNNHHFKFKSYADDEVKQEKIFSTKWQSASTNNPFSSPTSKTTNSLPTQTSKVFQYDDSEDEADNLIFSFDETLEYQNAVKATKTHAKEQYQKVLRELKFTDFGNKAVANDLTSQSTDIGSIKNTISSKPKSSPIDFFHQVKSAELSTSEITDIIFVESIDNTSPSNS